MKEMYNYLKYASSLAKKSFSNKKEAPHIEEDFSLDEENSSCSQRHSAPPRSIHPFTALTKYADFSGRATRQEFWLFVLVNFLISFIPYLGWIWVLVVLIPSFAVFCRRMHDTGRSGWNWFWGFLPILGVIILLIFECQDSEPGDNQYGPNPKGL